MIFTEKCSFRRTVNDAFIIQLIIFLESVRTVHLKKDAIFLRNLKSHLLVEPIRVCLYLTVFFGIYVCDAARCLICGRMHSFLWTGICTNARVRVVDVRYLSLSPFCNCETVFICAHLYKYRTWSQWFTNVDNVHVCVQYDKGWQANVNWDSFVRRRVAMPWICFTDTSCLQTVSPVIILNADISYEAYDNHTTSHHKSILFNIV